MKYLKNIEDKSVTLSDLIDIKENQILSLGLSKSDHCDLRLFSLYQNEEIHNEIYNADVIYFCLEGEMLVSKNDSEHLLKAYEAIAISAGTKSSLKAKKNAKMLQIMIGE